MLTQPPVIQFIGAAQAPLLPDLWQFFSMKSDADALCEIVKKVVLNAVVIDGTRFLTIPAISFDANCKVWLIQGTYNGGDVLEYAGSLGDRRTQPNGWVDKNPDSTVGGDQIFVNEIQQYRELQWRKVGSPPQ